MRTLSSSLDDAELENGDGDRSRPSLSVMASGAAKRTRAQRRRRSRRPSRWLRPPRRDAAQALDFVVLAVARGAVLLRATRAVVVDFGAAVQAITPDCAARSRSTSSNDAR